MQVWLFDSMAQSAGMSAHVHFAETARQYVQDETADKLGAEGTIDTSNWSILCPSREDVPQQDNFNDCGVFTIENMMRFSFGAPLTYSQDDVPQARRRVALELMEIGLRPDEKVPVR